MELASITKKENRNTNNGRLIHAMHIKNEVVGTAAVVLTTLFFCVSMTTIDDSREWYEPVFNAIMAACIIYGLAVNIVSYKKIDKPVLVLTVLYFVTRIISYSLNGISVTFGGAIMLQAFYLIGINRYLFGGRNRMRTALGTFLAFDVVIMLYNYYNYFFRPEYVGRVLEKYELKGMLPATNMFQSKNYAGMIAGAAIIICCAEILNRSFERKTVLLLSPVIALNMVMLFAHSHCRSGQTGMIAITILTAIILAVKKADSARRVVGLSLIVCALTLIPIYGIVYWGDNNEYLTNMTSLEQKLDDVSSYRYAIWKTVILSQEGHLLFGYGNNKNAAKIKNEYISSYDPAQVTISYQMAAEHKRQHNGYLAMINETGITGALLFILLLLARIRKFKGRFRDGQWEKMLLVYIFWLNIFEAKFILANFFTGFLLMIMLLPDNEDQSGALYVAKHASGKNRA